MGGGGEGTRTNARPKNTKCSATEETRTNRLNSFSNFPFPPWLRCLWLPVQRRKERPYWSGLLRRQKAIQGRSSKDSVGAYLVHLHWPI
jgi:hypothetical protein